MAAAVLARRDAALPLEELGEVALIPESRFCSDFRDELVGRLQQLADGVEADGGDVASGLDAERARELAAEVGGRGADKLRQLV